MYSTDECILMQNGNYSGWFKQACWDMWQAQHIENQSRIDELQKRLITQGQNFNDQSQHVRDLKFKATALQKQIDDSENTRAVLYRENMDLREGGIELEKQLSMMKYINDEQNKNLTNALKAIEVQQKFDVDSQGAIAHLTEMNNRYLGKMQEQQDTIASAKAVIKKHDRYIPHSTVEALEKALRGEHE